MKKIIDGVKSIADYLGEKSFLLGSDLTYVDFILFEFCDWMNWVTEGTVYTEYPTLAAYHSRMRGLKGVKEYYADDEKCFKKPFHNSQSKINNF